MSVVDRVMTYVGAYSATDIRALLHEDHVQIRALTRQMSGDGAIQQRVHAFERLKPLLTAHSRAEEQAVYTPLVNLRGAPEARSDANEGFVEHNLVDVLVARLSRTRLARTDAWKAHAEVLKEMLDHHITEEERGIFGELGEHFTDAQRDAMGQAFAQGKARMSLVEDGDAGRAAR